MTKEKRDKRVPIMMSQKEYDDLEKRVEATSFKNKSDYLRASIYLIDFMRHILKKRGIEFCEDNEMYKQIEDYRKKRGLDNIKRRSNKKHVTVPQIDPKLLNQIIRSGNNLNQISYSVNKAIRYNDKVSAYEILEKLLEIENQNKEIIELMKVSKYQNQKKEDIEENYNNEEDEENDSRIY